MKAMIFAAGKGTRLQPITHTIPKGMVTVGGKTMLEQVIEKLTGAGVTQVVINVHHHAAKMKQFIRGLNYPGLEIHLSDEEDLLLDTGGGLIHAREWLQGEDPFFIYNVDVLCDINLQAMWAAHQQHGALATLAVSDRRTSRYLLVDKNNLLAGWENTSTGQKILCRPTPQDDLRPMAFSGIHLVSPAIFSLIDAEGSFAILPEYLKIASSHNICCYEHDPAFWADIGTPAKLEAARHLFETHPDRFLPKTIL